MFSGIGLPNCRPGELFFFLDLDDQEHPVPETVAQPSISTPPTNVPGGVFSWTPDTVGTYTIRVFVTDDVDQPDQQDFTITVVDPSAAAALDAAFASLV